MRPSDTVTGRADRLRIGPWRGDPRIALVSPTPGRLPTATTLDRTIEDLAARGWTAVLTPALSEPEQQVFLDRGFRVLERLHLLGHDLRVRPEGSAPGTRLRRARRRDLPAVLELDGLAFDGFWRFDRDGLDDARRATPRSRFVVAEHDGEVVGYHVTGLSGRLGYLQRLAVHPRLQGRGVGTALIGDSLDWCARRHGGSVLVNTQETNAGALRLYRRLGFVDEPTGLAVLRLELDGSR